MNIYKQLNNYIDNNDYKITITNEYINITNYLEIKDFTQNKIIIKNEKSITKINGNNLIIKKILDNELIIIGDFISIEL